MLALAAAQSATRSLPAPPTHTHPKPPAPLLLHLALVDKQVVRLPQGPVRGNDSQAQAQGREEHRPDAAQGTRSGTRGRGWVGGWVGAMQDLDFLQVRMVPASHSSDSRVLHMCMCMQLLRDGVLPWA